MFLLTGFFWYLTFLDSANPNLQTSNNWTLHQHPAAAESDSNPIYNTKFTLSTLSLEARLNYDSQIVTLLTQFCPQINGTYGGYQVYNCLLHIRGLCPPV